MPDWSQKFKVEYDYARGWLKDAYFTEAWRPLIQELKLLATDTGFDPARATALTTLRAKTRQDPTGKAAKLVGRDEGIIAALAAPKGATGLSVENKMSAAALKLLCHVYLLNRSGNTQVWLHNLPNDFTKWATDAVFDCGTDGDVRKLLRSTNERFGFEAAKHFAQAPKQALAWCHKASIVLANAAKTDTKDKERAPARDLVRRWFADASVTESDLDGFIATLATGFKNITAAINAGKVIITDWAPLRARSTQSDIDWLKVKAFTFKGRLEGLDVVYIEEGFFKYSSRDVLTGQRHYSRIFLHELTHLVGGTIDVKRGVDRYAFNGIGPHSGYPGSDCIKNADNWACFGVDCGGAMSDSERAKALKIV